MWEYVKKSETSLRYPFYDTNDEGRLVCNELVINLGVAKPIADMTVEDFSDEINLASHR